MKRGVEIRTPSIVTSLLHFTAHNVAIWSDVSPLDEMKAASIGGRVVGCVRQKNAIDRRPVNRPQGINAHRLGRFPAPLDAARRAIVPALDKAHVVRLFKRQLKQTPRPEQSCLHGRNAHVDPLRYALHAHLLEVPKDQDLPALYRKLSDCLSNDLPCFSASE